MVDPTKIVDAVLEDLSDRKGFDEWWHGVDPGIRDEIISDLADTVEHVLDEPE
jgi:hypothetical protein